MDFNSLQEQKTSIAAKIGLDLDFYCKFSIEKVAQKFAIVLGSNVDLIPEADNFKPENGKYYIQESYGRGKERYTFICAPEPYSIARQIIIKVFATIKEFCYTDDSCIAKINFSYDNNLINLDIRKLNILKFVLEFNEDMMWRFFPSQQHSVYVQSIKNILPQNKFYRSENLDIKNFNYILPNRHYSGVVFDNIKDGVVQFRYVGGEDYEYKVTETLDVIGIFNSFLYKVLFAPGYTKKNKDVLKKIISNADRILKSYDSYENFVKAYPDIKLTVDLEMHPQIIKAKYVKFRDSIFDLLSSSNLNSGEINYDSAMSRIQIQKADLHIYEIHGWEFIECKLRLEYANDCSFFECHIEDSFLNNCNLYRYSKVKNSKLKDTYINRTCEIYDSYISGKISSIEGKINGGVIASGRMGIHSKVSKETDLIDYTKTYNK